MRTGTVSRAGICVCWMVLAIALTDQGQAAVLTDDECLACHGRTGLSSRRGASLFIEPDRFAKSAHAKSGVTCTSCHEGITSISRDETTPHRTGIEPKCGECHESVNREYSKSRHAKISKKICYSCHNPHYSVSFRQMSGEQRKKICLKCHDVTWTHRWLPQKQLHFNYLECTSCHALNAQIGLVFFVVDKAAPSRMTILGYDRLAPFIEKGKGGLVDTLDKDGDRKLSGAEMRSFMNRLRAGGVPGAGLEIRILVLTPTHNFTHLGEEARDCTLCHSKDAKFYSTLVLEIPERDGRFVALPVEKQILVSRVLRPFAGDLYLLGESKIRPEDLEDVATVVKRIGFKWLDLLGMFVVLLTLVAVAFHGTLMSLTSRFRRTVESVEKTESLPVAIRVWHWIHGLAVILLIMTGIQLRLPDVMPIFASFLNAVNLHNLTAVIVILDYLFWISYHLWRKEFKERFFISPGNFFRDTAQMLHYYGYLIFVGGAYPSGFSEVREI